MGSIHGATHAEHENFEVNKKRSFRTSFYIKRHRAIFPGLEDPSIVTAERLNCCVRYGNRCFPLAMGTETASPNEIPVLRVSHRADRKASFSTPAALPSL
jgi:hypothetical protein